MTDNEKLITLRAMLDDGVDEEDHVLSTFLKIAGDKNIARAYPFDHEETEVPKRYEYLQIEIALYLINKRGAEGEVTHTENGIQRQYENADIPASMLKEITPYCGVIK